LPHRVSVFRLEGKIEVIAGDQPMDAHLKPPATVASTSQIPACICFSAMLSTFEALSAVL
jgi:hypothetical protein